MKQACLAVLLMAFLAGPVVAADTAPARPGPRDKCPVCGMFVGKYPDWTAEVIWAGGSSVWFDGAKDLFRYLNDLKTYAPGRRAEEVRDILVTDYYAIEPVDGRQACYVIGSDVYGPMGKEFIPFINRAEAEGFFRDHKGKKIIQFNEVGSELKNVVE